MLAYLGLGSNLGDRRAMIAEAVRRLGATGGITVTKRSSLVDTAPVGGHEQPRYLNAACEIETTLSPQELLSAVLRIEREMGRTRGVRWGPRNIDIDILLYGESVIQDPDLTVPHPRLAERAFALGPLAEIAPDLRHPVTNQAISGMFQAARATKAAAEGTSEGRHET